MTESRPEGGSTEYECVLSRQWNCKEERRSGLGENCRLVDPLCPSGQSKGGPLDRHI